MFLGGANEVRSLFQEIEEGVFPEGSLERDTAVSGIFGDGTGEIVLVERIREES